MKHGSNRQRSPTGDCKTSRDEGMAFQKLGDEATMTSKSMLAIGDVAADTGQRARGFITIGETPSGAIEVPIAIINGHADGPVLCLTAGVHATEYAPIDAVLRTIDSLDPAKLRGAVIAVPVANMPMFGARTPFVSQIDGLNLNKIAPGRKDGSVSEILAHVLLEEVIAKARYHIDLHAGDFGEALWPFAGYPLTGNDELDREGEALARLYTPGMVSLSREGSTIPPFAGSIVYSASRQGIVSILAESGGDGTLEAADVKIHVDGIRNVMRYLGMIDGEPHLAGYHLQATDRFAMTARRAGLIRLKVAIGDSVAANQEVAEICDVFGEAVERIRSPRPGIVGLIWTHKVANTGDPVVRCWVTEPAPSFALERHGTRPEQKGMPDRFN